MKTPRLLLLALCGAMIASAQATTVIPPTFDELVARAEFIFEGTVTNVQSQWSGEGAQRHIVSYVTFKVDEGIKGEAGADYTLRLLGGTVDGQTMEVTDSPKFALGDRDILFVENNGKQFIPLVGIMHGRFRVKRDKATGAELVANDHGEALSDVANLGKEEAHLKSGPSAATQRSALGSTDFKAAIRAKLTTAAR